MSYLILNTQGEKKWISEKEPFPDEQAFVDIMKKRHMNDEDTFQDILELLLKEEGITYEELIYNLPLDKLLEAQSMKPSVTFQNLVAEVCKYPELDNLVALYPFNEGYSKILQVFTKETKMKVLMNITSERVKFQSITKRRKVITLDSESESSSDSDSESSESS